MLLGGRWTDSTGDAEIGGQAVDDGSERKVFDSARARSRRTLPMSRPARCPDGCGRATTRNGYEHTTPAEHAARGPS